MIDVGVGDRVELVHTSDPYTRLTPGTRGAVTFIDDRGTVHVRWDDGSQLGMVAQAGDQIRKVADAAASEQR